MRHLRFPLILLAALAASRAAHAQPAFSLDAADATVAQTLVDGGKQLLEKDQVEEAFAKFIEANRLAQSPAALLGMAECFERTGKTASAWGALKKAEERARALGDAAVAEEVSRRVRELEPKLTKLKVVLKGGGEAPSVRLDGVNIETWLGTAVPVDPGKHLLVALAPDKVTFSTAVELPVNGGTREVALPPLAPRPPEPEEPATKQGHVRRPRHPTSLSDDKVAMAFLVSGLAAGTVGGVVGYVGILTKDDTGILVGGSTLGGGVVLMVIGGLLWRGNDGAKVARGLPWERPWVHVAPLVARGSSGFVIQGVF